MKIINQREITVAEHVKNIYNISPHLWLKGIAYFSNLSAISSIRHFGISLSHWDLVYKCPLIHTLNEVLEY